MIKKHKMFKAKLDLSVQPIGNTLPTPGCVKVKEDKIKVSLYLPRTLTSLPHCLVR